MSADSSTNPRALIRARRTAFAVMGMDAVGTGMFLPVSVLYPMHVIGLSEATTGAVLAIAACLTLVLPGLVARWVATVPPRSLVLVGLGLQAIAMAAYLAAGGLIAVFAVVLLAVSGQRIFFASVYGLLADLAPRGPKDGHFAWAAAMQSGGTALGGLLAGAVLLHPSTAAYQVVVGVNAVSFASSALLVAVLVRPGGSTPPSTSDQPSQARGPRSSLLADRRFLRLIAATTLLVLPVPAISTLLPAYLVHHLDAPTWLPGTLTGCATALLTLFRPGAVRLLAHRDRVRVLQTIAALLAAWAAAMGFALLVPDPFLVPFLCGFTALYALAFLAQGPVSNGLVAAIAPERDRSRYLAASQYSFGIADAAAPGLVVLLSIAPALPWVVLSGGMLVAIGLLAAIGGGQPRPVPPPAETLEADREPVPA